MMIRLFSCTFLPQGSVNSKKKYGWWIGLFASILFLSVMQYLVRLHVNTSVKNNVTSWLDFDDTVEVKAVKENPHPEFRVAIAPVISLPKSLYMYKDLVDYLAKKMSKTPVMMQRQTYAEINDLVKHHNCDLAMICTYPFVQGEREFGLKALVAPSIHEEISYQALVLVPRGSSASTLLDLKGKRFAIASYDSSSGWLYPALSLRDQGEDPDHFFKEIHVTRGHDLSVDSLISGLVDGAAVSSVVFERMVQENNSLAQKLKVIARSSHWGMPPFVVHPDMDEASREKLEYIFISMHSDPEGKSILNKLNIDFFFVPKKSFYDSIRKNILQLEETKL